ncbi:MAG: C69 family dipeptidase, partial [Alistipes sp.]|nr:C69 family dipeptidase [Candidatus Minthomonas equi]
MKKIILLLMSLSASLGVMAQDEEFQGLECTSVVAGRLATTDCSVITSHTCDGWSHTWVNYVPAADHQEGETTWIRKDWRKTKFVTDTAGVRYIMKIPQVSHTYAYLNTGYPSLNEKQVAIGETTFTGPDTLINSNAPILIEELCRLALERCSSAREAVLLMGEIAEEYGYGDGGECLTVADKDEVWFFEITGVGKTKTGAAWVAQRVPDDEIAVSANIPRIGKIDRSDKMHFLASDNVEDVALENGLWNGEGDFVYWKAYNSSYGQGRNFREREFRVLSTFAPSLGLAYEDAEMPFSVKPDSLVSVRDVMAILRDTYEGTRFDMCRNVLLEVPAKDTVPAHKVISP